jgi:hypothetical protein
MYIRDKLGSFEVIVDKERRVVHEKLSGLFTYGDSDRLEKEYINNIIPYLGEGPWAKLCDMTDYIANTSVGHDDINFYIRRIVPYGFKACAVIASSEALKSYLHMATNDIDTFMISYFKSELEADEYLRKLGF